MDPYAYSIESNEQSMIDKKKDRREEKVIAGLSLSCLYLLALLPASMLILRASMAPEIL